MTIMIKKLRLYKTYTKKQYKGLSYFILHAGQFTLELLNSTSEFLHFSFILFRPTAGMIQLSTAVL